MAPPGFCNRGEVRYGSVGGLEYEVPQSRLYCLCISVALCSTALQCICRVIQRSSMTMKAHTYYIIFGRPPMGEASHLPRGGATVPCTPAHQTRHRQDRLVLSGGRCELSRPDRSTSAFSVGVCRAAQCDRRTHSDAERTCRAVGPT